MTVFDAEGFGRTLREKRKKLNYTQKALSELTGFSVSFISDLERGKPTSELGKALFLVNLLGMNCKLESRTETDD